MKLAKGPRPWSIRLFGVLLIIYAHFGLIAGLSFLDLQQRHLELQFPQFEWNRDWAIVWVSAQFTIALIPLIAVCLFASKVARWLVSAMALVSLPWIASYVQTFVLHGVMDWQSLVQALVPVICAGLLFMPSAAQWLRQEEVNDAATFE